MNETAFKHTIIRAEAQPVEMLTGVIRRTMATTHDMMLCEVEIAKDAVVPMHQHVHEQIGYVVKGRVRFVIDGTEHILSAGDSYAIPSAILHEATALEDAVVIDIFSPPREEYR